MNISKVEQWVLKRIFRKRVRQGSDHTSNVRMILSLLRDACEQEFTEDNAPTIDAFLTGQLQRTL